MRTLANVKAGGRTPLAGVLHASVLFLIVLGFGPVVALIPHAALAGILSKLGIAVVLASLVFVKETADAQVRAIRTIVDEEHHDLLTEAEKAAFRRCAGRAAILHLSAAMSFGAANEMVRRIVAVRPVDVLIVDLTDVPDIDGSAALTLEEIIQRTVYARQEVLIVGMQLRVARVLGRLGALDRVREATRFASRMEAIDTAAALVAERRDASTIS